MTDALTAALYKKAIWFAAVGMKYRGNHLFSSSDKVTLMTENENRFDSNAVKVLVGGKHVAYVARDQTGRVREMMEIGYDEIQFDKYNLSGTAAYFNML